MFIITSKIVIVLIITRWNCHQPRQQGGTTRWSSATVVYNISVRDSEMAINCKTKPFSIFFKKNIHFLMLWFQNPRFNLFRLRKLWKQSSWQFPSIFRSKEHPVILPGPRVICRADFQGIHCECKTVGTEAVNVKSELCLFLAEIITGHRTFGIPSTWLNRYFQKDPTYRWLT